ncbi:hypothetical protein, partial [Streptomyces laculatispora]|uniref:hypothetical protein n=1 Tax=Streptomyces laculatispora TaxID=887464 RepID=UPI0035146FB1
LCTWFSSMRADLTPILVASNFVFAFIVKRFRVFRAPLHWWWPKPGPSAAAMLAATADTPVVGDDVAGS